MTRTFSLSAFSTLLIGCFVSTIALAAGPAKDEISKPYHLKVIGASMADQLATGLRWEFQGDKSFKISQNAKAATGLIRKDVYNWQAALEEIVKDDKIDIAVVAIGGNDRQSFFRNGKRLRRFSVLWRAEYFKRLQKFMRTLTDNVPVVYWISLPQVRSKRITKDYVKLNGYFRDIGKPLGVTYLNIFGKFADKAGNYNSYGQSVTGRRRRLRQKDGIHYTMAGARKLGRMVGTMIRADLKNRKAQSLNAANALRKTQN